MANLTPHEIGEYTGCTHGADGDALFGCIPCAIEWTRRQAQHAADEHAAYTRRLNQLIAQQARPKQVDRT